MAAITNIEWTDHTFNPWHGCTKVHEGCEYCYAARQVARDLRGNFKATAERLAIPLAQLPTWGPHSIRQYASEAYWQLPIRWNKRAMKEGKRARVFCASMCDVFEEREDLDQPRQRLFTLIGETPHLDWQLLTKRPENICPMVPCSWLSRPPDNVWYGTSPCNQRTVSFSVPALQAVPATIRFLSIEPLIAPIQGLELEGIDWVIVGGESGPRARPMELEWVTEIRDQCRDAGVPFFFKQYGKLNNNPDKTDPTARENGDSSKGGRTLQGRTWDEFPVACDGRVKLSTFGKE